MQNIHFSVMCVLSTGEYKNVRLQKNSLFSFYQTVDFLYINIVFTELKITNYSKSNNNLKVVYF